MKFKKCVSFLAFGIFLLAIALYCIQVGKVSLRGIIFDSESPVFYFIILADVSAAIVCFGLGISQYFSKNNTIEDKDLS